MNYQPILKTLVPTGDYNFKITKSEETNSKAGKPMLKLTLSVWDNNNHKATLYWYCLLDSGFLRQISQACNVLEKYEQGKLEAHDFENKEGTCLVEIEENALYEKSNKIKTFYITKEEKKPEEDSNFDNDIPF
jgi:putative IMPACT (imprinted ancient) family translation regulator